MKIFGAGLAGLIAGCVFPKATIYERNVIPFTSHQALLRFRTDKISEITGIKFKKVKVLKSIWSEGKEVLPSPRLVALYSRKVSDKYENRSIMDISTTDRFIAPNNFHDMLIEDMKDRIADNYEINKDDYTVGTPVISTLPLSINAKMLGYDFKTEMNTSHIYVNKFTIKDCDMYSTIYYPDSDTGVYRASITGDTLIIESKYNLTISELADVKFSFGLHDIDLNPVLEKFKQPMGKLTKVNDDERRVQIYKMSHDHNIFSLGRFALHKNILLDDVAQDLFVIKSMINDDSYGISTMGRV